MQTGKKNYFTPQVTIEDAPSTRVCTSVRSPGEMFAAANVLWGLTRPSPTMIFCEFFCWKQDCRRGLRPIFQRGSLVEETPRIGLIAWVPANEVARALPTLQR
jgi:hypothetical protein